MTKFFVYFKDEKQNSTKRYDIPPSKWSDAAALSL